MIRQRGATKTSPPRGLLAREWLRRDSGLIMPERALYAPPFIYRRGEQAPFEGNAAPWITGTLTETITLKL